MIIISYIGLWFYLGIYVYYTGDITNIFKQMSDFTEFGKPPNFDKLHKMLETLSVIHYWYVNTLVYGAMLSPYFGYKFCKKYNREHNIDEVCGMIPVWVPFELDYFPMREIFLAVETFSAGHLYIPFAIMVFTMFESIEYIILRFKHLKILLEEALGENIEENVRSELFAKAVRYHDVIMG